MLKVISNNVIHVLWSLKSSAPSNERDAAFLKKKERQRYRREVDFSEDIIETKVRLWIEKRQHLEEEGCSTFQHGAPALRNLRSH
ncbi:hypothetical protein CEXT_681381 [Caerostris extrusa]|uniref:Uncharacterized protein n=1 Tax=Caerostris extrusa TaxID=172846 RepID=A0AAV4REW8_CAEEX|nr:hypothetical protein CEXT_681381 [Caerostris extrusa]